MSRRVLICWLSAAGCLLTIAAALHAAEPAASVADQYAFDGSISRDVLENYLSRSITMQGLLNGEGDFDDNLRMLKSMGAKYIGRSICLWGREGNLLQNLGRAKELVPKVHAADPQMILEACVFEIVSAQVEQVPAPEWAFTALGQPVEKRNFRYADMIYPESQRRNWGRNASVPDVSRPETKLWFYFLAASYIDLGFEGIHFGQVELMGRNDRDRAHWSQVLDLVRAYAAKHARRHFVLCNGHVPSGGLVRDGHLLLDFHAFPLRIKEVPEKPEEAILQVGFSDGIYGRSKGGITPSGWKCDHLPYLVELGQLRRQPAFQPGQGRSGQHQVWGYGEISWFAHQPASNTAAAGCGMPGIGSAATTDPGRFLEMPGGSPPADRRSTSAAGTTRTLQVPPSPMAWATKTRFEPSGPPTRSSSLHSFNPEPTATGAAPRAVAVGSGLNNGLINSVTRDSTCVKLAVPTWPSASSKG